MAYAQDKPIAVVKVGGEILLDQQELAGLANNVNDLIKAGWHCVVLHGGGPQVTALQSVHGLTENKIGGRRITSKADLTVVKQALCGECNVGLVAALSAQGINAFGCHGASGRLIGAQRRPPMVMQGTGGKVVDFGEVGDVQNVNSDLLVGLLQLDQVPVIASLGINPQGEVFNINADTTAAMLAKGLKASALFLATKVGALYADLSDLSSRIKSINPEQAEALIKQGAIRDGMIPKVQEALSVASAAGTKVAVCNTAEKGCFLSLIDDNSDFGTRFLSD